jgi:hypothetical protein
LPRPNNTSFSVQRVIVSCSDGGDADDDAVDFLDFVDDTFSFFLVVEFVLSVGAEATAVGATAADCGGAFFLLAPPPPPPEPPPPPAVEEDGDAVVVVDFFLAVAMVYL